MAPPIQLPAWKLCDLFNSVVLPRIEAKELLEVVEDDNPAPPQSGQPSGSRSQMVAYFELKESKMRKIAVAHRYLLPDGTLGASGKPDPKSMKHEGEFYVLNRKAK
jgi:hypothetical protein